MAHTRCISSARVVDVYQSLEAAVPVKTLTLGWPFVL